MTVKDVQRRVAEIDALGNDPESAHGSEDQLYVEVLTAIAEGVSNPGELAAAALKAAELDYTRWYA
jgi:hypothetical protein